MNCDNNNVPANTLSSANFVSVFTVLERLARNYPDLDFEEYAAINWVGEAMQDIGLITNYTYHKVLYDIENYQICLPCNFYKLMSITNENGITIRKTTALNDTRELEQNGIFYSMEPNGIYMNFTITNRKVWLTYLGLPIDENGYPLVHKDCVTACESYCLWKMLSNGYFSPIGKTTESQYRMAVSHWSHQKAKAKGKQLDQNTITDWARVWLNIATSLKPMNNDMRHINKPFSF